MTASRRNKYFTCFRTFLYKVELITNIIVEYLKYNKRIVVPKLGAFIVKQPSGNIVFSELMRGDDGILCSLLKAYGLNDLEANGAIDRFVFEVRFATSKQNSYTIDNFGTFTPGPNNTITFKQKREPKTFGGNVRPPVDMLDNVKPNPPRPTTTGQGLSEPTTPHNTRRGVQRVAIEDDAASLTTPDKYLRGLNYDKAKNKKREEKMFNAGSRSNNNAGRMLKIMLVAAIAIAAGAWFAWQHLNEDKMAETQTQTAIQTATTTEITDSLTTETITPIDAATTPQLIDASTSTAVEERTSTNN